MKAGECLNKLQTRTGYQRSQIKRWARKESELLAVKGSAKRIRVGGRKPLYNKLEDAIIRWFREERAKKLVVSYTMFREKAKRLVETFPGNDYMDFMCSDHWIRNICRRHNICSRKVTHVSQQQTKTKAELLEAVNDFFRCAKQKTCSLSPSNIYNMDETPCYFDMCHNRTLHFKGEKAIDGLDSGHSKNRFTVVLMER